MLSYITCRAPFNFISWQKKLCDATIKGAVSLVHLFKTITIFERNIILWHITPHLMLKQSSVVYIMAYIILSAMSCCWPISGSSCGLQLTMQNTHLTQYRLWNGKLNEPCYITNFRLTDISSSTLFHRTIFARLKICHSAPILDPWHFGVHVSSKLTMGA